MTNDVSLTKIEHIPFPSSPKAIEQGCTCPPIDNNFGEGITFNSGNNTYEFIVSDDCPLHGHNNSNKTDKKNLVLPDIKISSVLKPNPGSEKAKELGCTCPSIDNNYGRGIFFNNSTGRYEFVVFDNCPLHRDIYEEVKKECEEKVKFQIRKYGFKPTWYCSNCNRLIPNYDIICYKCDNKGIKYTNKTFVKDKVQIYYLLPDISQLEKIWKPY